MKDEILDVGLVWVPYVWVVSSNGLIEETKMKKEMDLNTVKPGDVITNFYEEKFPLYNLSGSEYSLTSKGCISIENIGKKERVIELLSQLVSEMKAVDIEDLHLGFPNEKSMYEKIQDELKKYSISIVENKEFSLDRYIEIRNSLCYEVSNLNSKSKACYGGLIRLFDGFLYREGFFKSSDGISLVERDDDDKEYIPYSALVKSFEYFINFSSCLQDFDKNQYTKSKLSPN